MCVIGKAIGSTRRLDRNQIGSSQDRVAFGLYLRISLISPVQLYAEQHGTGCHPHATVSARPNRVIPQIPAILKRYEDVVRQLEQQRVKLEALEQENTQLKASNARLRTQRGALKTRLRQSQKEAADERDAYEKQLKAAERLLAIMQENRNLVNSLPFSLSWA